jgi:hypothetical protein
MQEARLKPSKPRRSAALPIKPSSLGVVAKPPASAPVDRGRTMLLLRLRQWRECAIAPLLHLLALPPPLRGVIIAVVALCLFAAANIAYHVMRKPTELFFPVSRALNKTPSETWRQYGPIFNEYSTAAITPDLLAALAQVESTGNPVARTYWRWRLSWNPFEIYQPASSAVGMFQLTDAILADARRYCIRNHVVIAEGAWNDWRSCWFNRFRSRAVPSHAIELAAVSLDRKVTNILARRLHKRASVQQKQDLAVIAHLCGAGPAAAFARNAFQPVRDQRCGDHDVAGYLARVNALRRQFRGLAK